MVIFMEAKPSLLLVQVSEHLPDDLHFDLKIDMTVLEVESSRETSSTDSAIFHGGSLVSPSSSDAGTCDPSMADGEEDEPEEEEGFFLDAFEDPRVMNKIEVLAKMVGVGESTDLGDVLSEVVRVLRELEEARMSFFCLDYNTFGK